MHIRELQYIAPVLDKAGTKTVSLCSLVDHEIKSPVWRPTNYILRAETNQPYSKKCLGFTGHEGCVHCNSSVLLSRIIGVSECSGQ